ncbi:MAG: hypothetical protein IMY72_12795 [Bacteroidetes bacterium]|nr:hypothetical protein [Bacteroidota bacterium]
MKFNECPEIIDNISGTTYFFMNSTDSIADNIEFLILNFNNKQCRLILNQKGESLDALVGLDNIYKVSKKNNVALKGS